MKDTIAEAREDARPTAKPRTKRSWTKVEIKLGDDTVTFWPTPDGLHRRKKGSPKVQAETWEKINDFIVGAPFKFRFDNRDYEVWRGAEGIHMRRGAEVKIMKWPQFIEHMDGQKLLGI